MYIRKYKVCTPVWSKTMYIRILYLEPYPDTHASVECWALHAHSCDLSAQPLFDSSNFKHFQLSTPKSKAQHQVHGERYRGLQVRAEAWETESESGQGLEE
jgi:hypothetical protein